MAEPKIKQIDDDEKKEDKSPFSLNVSVQNNKLKMELRDNKTKKQYHTAFSPEQLQSECGFSNKQITNLHGICKFIETAKGRHNNLKISISIEQTDKGNNVANDKDDAEGVYGVHVESTLGSEPAPSDKAAKEEVAVVKISKEDDFFGEMEFIMKLKQIPREKIDILEEHIKDLQIENAKLKSHTVPKGSILMWSGSANNIPYGWALCNGENNTPDLRGKFILGNDDDQYKIGDNGGSTLHQHDITVGNTTLTIDQIPSHSHQTDVLRYSETDGSGAGWNNKGFSDSHKSFNSASQGGGQPHAHSGSCTTSKVMPPYVVLGYIMKLV